MLSMLKRYHVKDRSLSMGITTINTLMEWYTLVVI
jgi:glycerol-3-phosphate O-acyltransferase/dihydroxyacetone phosphate acyltransferase